MAPARRASVSSALIDFVKRRLRSGGDSAARVALPVVQAGEMVARSDGLQRTSGLAFAKKFQNNIAQLGKNKSELAIGETRAEESTSLDESADSAQGTKVAFAEARGDLMGIGVAAAREVSTMAFTSAMRIVDGQNATLPSVRAGALLGDLLDAVLRAPDEGAYPRAFKQIDMARMRIHSLRALLTQQMAGLPAFIPAKGARAAGTVSTPAKTGSIHQLEHLRKAPRSPRFDPRVAQALKAPPAKQKIMRSSGVAEAQHSASATQRRLSHVSQMSRADAATRFVARAAKKQALESSREAVHASRVFSAFRVIPIAQNLRAQKPVARPVSMREGSASQAGRHMVRPMTARAAVAPPVRPLFIAHGVKAPEGSVALRSFAAHPWRTLRATPPQPV